jgi:NADH:ubiquinone oxidoreductase subunit E
MEHLQSRLGIKNGETSKDGLFTLTAVECIGSCDVAPAMMINQSYHNNLSKEQLDKILDGLSQAENVL